ncbi:hypothetical protein PV327_011488, partial [Microctonus hyperodae]
EKKIGIVLTTEKLLKAVGIFDTAEMYIDGTFDARPNAPTSMQLLVVSIKKKNMAVSRRWRLLKLPETGEWLAILRMVWSVPLVSADIFFEAVAEVEDAIINILVEHAIAQLETK